MPFILKVPFQDKEEVKKLGAWWLPEKKAWAIPDHVKDVDQFKKWIPYDDGCIVRKPFLIAVSQTNCWSCGETTPMVAPGSKNYYFYDFLDETDEDNDEHGWIWSDYPALFSDVVEMDQQLIDYMAEHYPHYQLTWSHTQKQSTWANTCVHCKKLQGDFFAHSEMGGAFFPDPYSEEPVKIAILEFSLDFDYHIDGAYFSTVYEDFM